LTVEALREFRDEVGDRAADDGDAECATRARSIARSITAVAPSTSGVTSTLVVPTSSSSGWLNSCWTFAAATSGVSPPTATPPMLTPNGIVAGGASSAAAGADATRRPAANRRQRRFTLSNQ